MSWHYLWTRSTPRACICKILARKLPTGRPWPSNRGTISLSRKTSWRRSWSKTQNYKTSQLVHTIWTSVWNAPLGACSNMPHAPGSAWGMTIFFESTYSVSSHITHFRYNALFDVYYRWSQKSLQFFLDILRITVFTKHATRHQNVYQKIFMTKSKLLCETLRIT